MLTSQKLLVCFSLLTAFTAFACAQVNSLVLVEGGTFKNTKSNYYQKSMVANSLIGRIMAVKSFYIGKYEVTQKEWTEMMGHNPSKFIGESLPVESVSWYDCIEYCNRRSAKEGLTPYYTVDKTRRDPANKSEVDDIKWIVKINEGANGYRLPTEAEWEYAAEGGQKSENFLYSGSDDIEKVAWFWTNSGDKPLNGFWSWPRIQQNHNQPKTVGAKASNELGLFDMSGNVREWCWNWYADTPSFGNEPKESSAGRVWRGGGWLGGDFCCASAFRAGYEASGKGPDQGFRICRNP
ncbi:MAG TPA: formylglycine-generating enzyme family protein [Opitutaceae bacterium]